MIYIPKQINVGFQSRAGTYTGKLAYIIYYDERGKLRKESSWNSWRDEKIPNEEYDNIPTSGFVLNKKVGGVEESYGWDPRRTYTRVYDPRGYEFEITIPNLLWILENCNCIRGKGLEGEFVYGWDGKDLLLIPVDAPEYKDYAKNSDIRNKAEYIKSKELKLGYTYKTLRGEEYVYLGKFDRYEYETIYATRQYHTYHSAHDDWRYPEDIDKTQYVEAPKYMFSTGATLAKTINMGKHFFFMCLNNTHEYRKPEIVVFKSLTRKFFDVSDEASPEYPNYINDLEHCTMYSTLDFNRVDTVELSPPSFVNELNRLIESQSWWPSSQFISGSMDKIVKVEYSKSSKLFMLGVLSYKPEDVVSLYYKIKPIYKIFYLANGNEYMRRCYHE